MSILKLLSTSKYISGQTIASRLRVSRAAVHKQILALRARGFAIEGKKNLGYILHGKPDLLSQEKLKTGLVSEIVYRYECVSTQLIAKEIAMKGGDEGVLVVSEKQTCGYGRLERKWESPAGGIWFSLVLRPDIPPERAPQVTLIMSLAIVKAVKELYGLKLSIKWPNDVLYGNNKISGILTEMSAEVGKTNWVVVGVGLNANNKISKELGGIAASISSVIGKQADRTKLLTTILRIFSKDYKKLVTDGFKPFRDSYVGFSSFLGNKIKVSMRDNIVTGTAKSIDPDGYLILDKGGKSERILSGDIVINNRKGETA
jgi:BirA family biotin operon repressor/biotin-[acetyl-CoA-carboxylase] ligase